MKVCSGCKISKEPSEFHKDSLRLDGLTHNCKTCRTERYRKWYADNPEIIKRVRLDGQQRRKEYYQSPERKKKYRIRYIEKMFGIPYSEYDKMLAEQNFVCAICGKPETSSKCNYLSVDHDHETNEIRGLLCVSCNRGIGMFWDNIQLLEKAISYLRKNSCNSVR